MTNMTVKQGKVRNHFMFGCSYTCTMGCMKDFERFYKKAAKVDRTNFKIEIGDDRFLFFSNINDSPEKLCGLTCVDFNTCANYQLSDEVLAYVLAHQIKEAPAGDPSDDSQSRLH
jgi:hypothetical protein